MQRKNENMNIKVLANPKRKFISYSFIAIILASIISSIFLVIIYKYCISIFEVTIPNRENYYSREALFSVRIPITVYLSTNILVLLLTIKRYRLFSILYFVITILVAIYSIFFIETSIIRGI